MISNVGFWNIKMEKQQDLQAVIGVMPYFITIAREKQIKGWLRERKERLIETMNPGRVDLAADF